MPQSESRYLIAKAIQCTGSHLICHITEAPSKQNHVYAAAMAKDFSNHIVRLNSKYHNFIDTEGYLHYALSDHLAFRRRQISLFEAGKRFGITVYGRVDQRLLNTLGTAKVALPGLSRPRDGLDVTGLYCQKRRQEMQGRVAKRYKSWSLYNPVTDHKYSGMQNVDCK